MSYLTRLILLLAITQVILHSCASTKSRDEQGVVAKAWHNTNAHYNGYFNAREIMQESMAALDAQHEDNYNQRLKLFPFLDGDNASAVTAELDRAIEKVAIVVKKHPYSNWTDDSYLLVGQAQLIKQDYESAERTLNFTVNEFRPRPKRKKTKKGEREETEEEFESRREIEATESQSRSDKLRARRDAQRERERTIKQRQKEARAAQKERDRVRKEKIRARKKGIRLPTKPAVSDTLVAGLENEPETDEPEVAEMEEGPVGMISIFSNRDESDGDGGEYGKKPGSYVLKHRPAYQESRLWLAWTLIKRDNYDRAQIILEDLRNDRATFAEVRRKAIAVQAYLYLEQDRLEEAIPYLEAAGEVAESRNERARYYYIAGQLYQELNQPAGARGAFEQVVAAKPTYEFELGARINMAQSNYLSGNGSPDDAIRTLERMAKEEKNLAYESQLLYAMAGIAMRSGDDAGGAEYLRRALASPSGGSQTRVEAYQLLGDLAFAEGDYLPAKLYYDSTLQVMGQTDTRYGNTTDRRDRLGGVASSLESITLRDSLLRIGLLPENERRSWAEEVFELRRATNSAANFSTPNVQGSIAISNPVAGNSGSANNGSAFWGYNSQTIRRGSRDFSRRWGDRALEDNWRRSNRTDASLFSAEGDGIAGSDPSRQQLQLVTEEEIEGILSGIPIDTQSQDVTRRELADAYFTLGREYRDRVEDSPRAIKAFEELNRRYPGTDYEAESWYYLYLLQKAAGNSGETTGYAKKLADKYPDSKFARLANDPTYAGQLLDEEGRRGREYDAAYAAFEARDYDRANQLVKSSGSQLAADHPLKARYDLLQSLIVGKLEGRAAYVTSLQQVVRQYEGSPEQSRAREILRLLGESGARLPGRQENAEGSTFKESMDEIHYILVVFNNSQAQLNELKGNLEDYNAKYNKLDRIRATPIFIGRDNETPVLVLRRFKSGREAMDYYQTARQNSGEFLADTGEEFEIYPVSQSNYREILKARSFTGYGEWFSENY